VSEGIDYLETGGMGLKMKTSRPERSSVKKGRTIGSGKKEELELNRRVDLSNICAIRGTLPGDRLEGFGRRLILIRSIITHRIQEEKGKRGSNVRRRGAVGKSPRTTSMFFRGGEKRRAPFCGGREEEGGARKGRKYAHFF